MIIEIDDYEFGEDNYIYEVYVNGMEKEVTVEDKKINIGTVNESDTVELRAKNVIFSSKYWWAIPIIYWIASMLTGSGTNNPFGKPFDALLQITSIKTNHLSIRTNKIWSDCAFKMSDCNVKIIKNSFISTAKYRRRWCMGFVFPINIFLILFIVMCIFLGFYEGAAFGKIFLVVPVLAFICWNVYAYKVVKTLKNKIFVG